MRENGESMEGRSDSISQVYARRQTPVSRTHLLSPGIWANVQRDAMTPVPLGSANVGPIFSVKELNPFDLGLDRGIVRSQVFEGSEYEGPTIESRESMCELNEIWRPQRASDEQLPWGKAGNFMITSSHSDGIANWRD
ncbi:hypothetical protein G5I_07186 [Acromyrmex echinatior]|uniref:Uncharacterized protein n=1 Tax=Acromyrmex echinatior TaxID=103372 RepID=F4WN39_ACREC|nr:hypothetical protein G5I_07186 [Acromyrmex echinatior]